MLDFLRPCLTRAGVLCAVAAALAGGCSSYAPSPLDTQSHVDRWRGRAATDDRVLDRARRTPVESAGSFDPGDGLSLAEAEVVALVYNPDLRIARLQAGVAAAGAAQAGLWADPVLGFGGEKILASVDHPWIVGGTVGVTLPVSGRLGALKALASAEKCAALAQVAAGEWSVRAQLRSAWLRWSADLDRIEAIRGMIGHLDDVAATAQRLVAAGEILPNEARLIATQRAGRAVDLTRAESRVREAAIEIRKLMGLRPDAPVDLVPSLERAVDVAADIDAACVRRNPALAALRAEYGVAEASLRSEIRKQYPDLTISPGFSDEDGDPRALFGVSLPVPLWNRNQEGIAVAHAQREVARAKFEGALERTLTSAAQARVRVGNAAAVRERIEQDVLPLATQQRRELAELRRFGRFDPLLVLQVLQDEFSAKIQHIEAHLDESLAEVQLEELIGPPFEIQQPESRS